MTRLLPILALALVPAAFAAPVPRQADPPPFGPDGLLSEADLEKVMFDSRPVPKDEVERVKPLDRLLREEAKPKRQRAKNEFDVAVHITQSTFRAGGPA
ncbi:MAG: hypothetical protein K2V38_09275, partial [Gemmataceae bacterium]|nr:hypothetical protein [Gemmataceae bacterium]